jgi:hypothetical protein
MDQFHCSITIMRQPTKRNGPFPNHTIALSGLLLSLCLSATANADPADLKKEREARKACLLGDYAKGVSILTDLFVKTNQPNYIFNQGRCYQQGRRYEDAIATFREYLRVAKNPQKELAEKHISNCEELLAKEKPQTTVTPPPPDPPVVHKPIVDDVTTSPKGNDIPIVRNDPPAQNQSSGAGLRLAGILTASAGGAALVAGIIFNLKANSIASEMKKTGQYTEGKASDRDTYETLGWVGYGVGTACVATGAVLYILGAKSRSNNVGFLPTFAPGYAGGMLKGAF